MKHLLPALIAAMPLATHAQELILSEDFDSYSNGDLLAQTAGLPWSTWSNSPGSIEDTPLSSGQAASGSLSARFLSNSGTGGPSDIVLRLGDRTSGVYGVGWNMYIPAGSGGYFNIQKYEVVTTGAWGLDVSFRASGAIELSTNATAIGSPGFPGDTWFAVYMLIDLNAMEGTLFIDNAPVATWNTMSASGGGSPVNQLGAINFFAYAGGAPDLCLYYIDDVTFVDLSNVGIGEATDLPFNTYPNPVSDVLWVELSDVTPNGLVSLMDPSGRVLIDGHPFLQNGAMSRAGLDLAGLPAGIYLLRVQDGTRNGTRQIAKL